MRVAREAEDPPDDGSDSEGGWEDEEEDPGNPVWLYTPRPTYPRE